MIGRTELKQITFEIKSFNDIPSLSALQKIATKIDLILPRYEAEERSLQGKTTIFGDLSESLQAVSRKITASLPWFIRIANVFHCWETDEQKLLRSMLSHLNLSINRAAKSLFSSFKFSINKACASRVLSAADSSTRHKINECAFRILRGTSKDLSGLDSNLDGACVPNVLTRYAKNVTNFLNRFKEEMALEQVKLLENAQKLLTEAAKLSFEQINRYDFLTIDLNSIPDEMEADLSFEIEERIDALEIGSRLLVPGGYGKKSLGHAVLYEIRRESSNSYRFTVFNTGAGAELGQGFFGYLGILFTGKVGKISFPASKCALMDQSFWIHLFSFLTIPSEDNSMTRIYDLLSKHFSQKYGAEPEILEAHELQQWGNCSFECIAAYMESILPQDLSLCLQKYMVLEAIEELKNLLPEAKREKLLNKFTIRLLEQESSEALHRIANKVKQFWQSNQELHIANHLLQQSALREPSQLSSLLEKKMQRIEELNEQISKGFFSWIFADPALVQERDELQRELSLCEEELRKKNPGASLKDGSSELFSWLRFWLQRHALFAKIA